MRLHQLRFISWLLLSSFSITSAGPAFALRPVGLEEQSEQNKGKVVARLTEPAAPVPGAFPAGNIPGPAAPALFSTDAELEGRLPAGAVSRALRRSLSDPGWGSLVKGWERLSPDHGVDLMARLVSAALEGELIYLGPEYWKRQWVDTMSLAEAQRILTNDRKYSRAHYALVAAIRGPILMNLKDMSLDDKHLYDKEMANPTNTITQEILWRVGLSTYLPRFEEDAAGLEEGNVEEAQGTIHRLQGPVRRVAFTRKLESPNLLVVAAGDQIQTFDWTTASKKNNGFPMGEEVLAVTLSTTEHPVLVVTPTMAVRPNAHYARLQDFRKDGLSFGVELPAAARLYPHSLAFSPNRKLLLVTGKELPVARIQNLAPEDSRRYPQDGVLARMTPSQGRPISGAFHPAGGTVALGTSAGTVELWRLPDPAQPGSRPKLLAEEKEHGGAVLVPFFSPNGEYLATGDAAGNVRLWQWDERTENLKLLYARALRFGSGKPIHSISFLPVLVEDKAAPGGKARDAHLSSAIVAAAGQDGQVYFWDVASGYQLAVLRPERPTPIFSISFSPDGSKIAAGRANNTPALWDVPRSVTQWAASLLPPPAGLEESAAQARSAVGVLEAAGVPEGGIRHLVVLAFDPVLGAQAGAAVGNWARKIGRAIQVTSASSLLEAGRPIRNPSAGSPAVDAVAIIAGEGVNSTQLQGFLEAVVRDRAIRTVLISSPKLSAGILPRIQSLMATRRLHNVEANLSAATIFEDLPLALNEVDAALRASRTGLEEAIGQSKAVQKILAFAKTHEAGSISFRRDEKPAVGRSYSVTQVNEGKLAEADIAAEVNAVGQEGPVRLLVEANALTVTPPAGLEETQQFTALLTEIAGGRAPEEEEVRRLAALLKSDPVQTAILPVPPGGTPEKLVRERIETLQRVWPAFSGWWREYFKEKPVPVPVDTLWRVYVPLSQWIVQQKRRVRPDGAYLFGVSGSPGIGKTVLVGALASILNALLAPEEGRAVARSIDDYYKSKQDREALRPWGYDPGPGVSNRGPAGTHYTDWIGRNIKEFENSTPESETALGNFDKSIDDQPAQPFIFRGKVGIFLLEGWFLGANTRYDLNQIEPGFKRVVADANQRDYREISDRLDALLVFRQPPIEEIKRAREEQEQLNAKQKGKRGMSPEAIERFVDYFYADSWDWKNTSPVPRMEETTFLADVDADRRFLSIETGGQHPFYEVNYDKPEQSQRYPGVRPLGPSSVEEVHYDKPWRNIPAAGLEEWRRIPLDALPAEVWRDLGAYGLNVVGAEYAVLTPPRDGAEPLQPFAHEGADAAIPMSVNQALGSVLFSGLGKDYQVTADGNAVFMGFHSLIDYTLRHPDAAFVVLGDEGEQDASIALRVGSIFFRGEIIPFEDLASLREKLVELRAFKDEQASNGVTIWGLIGDALEVTKGLVEGWQDSWGLLTVVDLPQDAGSLRRITLIPDALRRVGWIYRALRPAGDLTPFDPPEVGFPKIARTYGINPAADRDQYAAWLREQGLMTLDGGRRFLEPTRTQGKTLAEQYSGFQTYFPDDGTVAPAFLTAHGIGPEGRRALDVRHGYNEGITGEVLVRNAGGDAHFVHTATSVEGASGAASLTKQTAHDRLTSNERAVAGGFGLKPHRLTSYETEQDAGYTGIVAMTSVNGVSPGLSRELAARVKGVEFQPDPSGFGGTVVTHTLVSARDGSSYIVRTTLRTDDLPEAKVWIKLASRLPSTVPPPLEKPRRETQLLEGLLPYVADANLQAVLDNPKATVSETFRYTLPEQLAVLMRELKATYHLTFLHPGRIGSGPAAEYYRTRGHFHTRPVGELVEIYDGSGSVLLWQVKSDDPSFAARAVRLQVKAGDKFFVPPGWAHLTLNETADQMLVFGTWLSEGVELDYAKVSGRRGGPWYIGPEGQRANQRYEGNVPELEVKAPDRDYLKTLGIPSDRSLWSLGLIDEQRFRGIIGLLSVESHPALTAEKLFIQPTAVGPAAGLEEKAGVGLAELKEQRMRLPSAVARESGWGAVAGSRFQGLAYGLALSRVLVKDPSSGLEEPIPVAYIVDNEAQASGLEELGVSRSFIFRVGAPETPDLDSALGAANQWLRWAGGVTQTVELGVKGAVTASLQWILENLFGIRLDAQSLSGLEEFIDQAAYTLQQA